MFIIRVRQKRFIRVISLLLVCFFVIAVVCPINHSVMAVSSSADTLDLSKLWANKRDTLEWCDENNIPQKNMWAYSYGTEDKENETVPIRVIVSDNAEDKVNNDTFGRRLSGDVTDKDSTITPYYYTYNGQNSAKPNLYNDVVNSTNDDGLALYYTIEEDSALGGAYRRYYVSTANQLAVLLYAYEKEFDKRLKAQSSETNGMSVVNKVGITLLNDIDLGGASEVCWYGYLKKDIVLDIDGQGHNIYNGYFKGNNNYFLGRSGDSCDNKFSIRNVTFSHMFITHTDGIFGGASTGWKMQYAYFENVDFEYCMAANTNQGTSIVLGGHHAYCYLKDCTVRNSYIYGGNHCGILATYNPEEEFSKTGEDHRTISYLGDDASGIEKYYYTYVPDLEEAELAWYGEESQNKNYLGKQLTSKFPTIYENCATIDCEVYSVGGVAKHSGTFISCESGFVICRNCFTNSTIYGKTQMGVFVGACMGASDGFYYEVDGKREFTNSVFESCYASGSVECNTIMGGFVGGIFSDSQDTSRQNSPNRGKVVFKNCYSTSSVGLQYASVTAMGGFVGDVLGNSMGTTEDTLADKDEQAHIIENCYVAGEVGNILTCTDKVPSDNGTINKNNSVGGFMGTYHSIYSEIDIRNCYYDKQTTAMRERDIGCAAKRGTGTEQYTIKGTTTTQLCGTLAGITGVYTKASTAKKVEGLTDTVDMGDDSVWTYETDYYPQLTTFTSSKYLDDKYANGDLIDQMKYERALLYKRCSFASAATVFLDHYDKMLDESGNSVSAIDQGVYDTVRDITSKFEFTSTCDDEIIWSVDTKRNESNKFASKLSEFTMTYGLDEEDEEDETNKTDKTYDKTYAPSVLTIDEVDNVFKCFDFAPGKQWVRVDVSESGETNDNGFVGTRQLRLLPMAYLNAGDIISVKVKANDFTTYGKLTTVWTNEVYYNDGSEDKLMTTKFNHSYGVVYAITERARQLSDNYNNQIVSSYNDASSGQTDDYFAMYGGYLLKSPMSNKVGLNGDKMYDQKFDGLKDDNNQSKNGLTMVRVFKTKPTSTGENKVELIQVDEVDLTDETTRSKWEGDTPFTSKDAGYYYMRYYWRFDDGRYLEDVKFVYISEGTYNVEAVTGILNNPHTVDGSITDGLKSPVDQFVSPMAVDEYNILSYYPSYDEDFNEKTAEDYYDYFTDEYAYNAQIKFDDGGTYYVKADSLPTSSGNTTVGWHYTDDYKMTTLIVEAHDIYENEWHEMARVNADEVKTRRKFNFDNAEYRYNFATYTVTQDKETKLFTVETQPDNEVTFTVESYKFSADKSTDQYITFAFGNEDGVSLATINDDLRVTVLFRKITPDVSGDKSVLLETDSSFADDNSDYLTEDITGTEALRVGEAYKSVDNTGLEDAKRMAVLPGSMLTYRVHLQNNGFDDAENVVVSDTVPIGCTYMKGSQRIYRQYRDITGGTVAYGSLERWDTDSDCDMKYDSGELEWIISSLNLEYDYYFEYRVTVDELKYSTFSTILTNTAEFSYTDKEAQKTNTVETDVGWLYMNIKKEIPVNDKAQNFLFRVDYYDSDTATTPSGTFYTDINCAEEVDDVYTGSQIIQCIKPGKYVVTEMDDWSATDYDFKAAYFQANAAAEKTAVSGKSVTVTLPNTSLKNGALLTAQIKNPSEYAPVVTFTSTESEYAYNSAQSGVENILEIK